MYYDEKKILTDSAVLFAAKFKEAKEASERYQFLYERSQAEVERLEKELSELKAKFPIRPAGDSFAPEDLQ